MLITKCVLNGIPFRSIANFMMPYDERTLFFYYEHLFDICLPLNFDVSFFFAIKYIGFSLSSQMTRQMINGANRITQIKR